MAEKLVILPENREQKRGKQTAFGTSLDSSRAHAEWAVALRVLGEAETKTPNRERLGAEWWWWTLPLGRTFLNNACGLVRKRTEKYGGNYSIYGPTGQSDGRMRFQVLINSCLLLPCHFLMFLKNFLSPLPFSG